VEERCFWMIELPCFAIFFYVDMWRGGRRRGKERGPLFCCCQKNTNLSLVGRACVCVCVCVCESKGQGGGGGGGLIDVIQLGCQWSSAVNQVVGWDRGTDEFIEPYAS